MADVELRRLEEFAYREAVPEEDGVATPVLCVHGFPESSLMWTRLMSALADEGHRCVAPDLFCLGDSPDPGPATFERNLEALTRFTAAMDLGRVALVVHDWGAFVGLAWACEHPDQVAALVIADAGFFHDGRWHGIAKAVRADGGEGLLEELDRQGFANLLRFDGAPFTDDEVDVYWRPFAEGRGREATVEFYRSMDFEKLAPYEGRLAGLAVPTLLVWGAEDRFAPIGGARRFEREIPGARLIAFDAAGHFVFDAEPERSVATVTSFLGEQGVSGGLAGRTEG